MLLAAAFYLKPDVPQITAHRGGGAAAPENTITAFQTAIENGADYIELDVTQTKDHKLVIFHDDNLQRITGVNKSIWELTYDEIRQLDAGSYMGEPFQGEKIPDLSSVLELCKGKIKLNIELKYHGNENAEFVSQVVETVKEKGMERDCIFTSFHYDFLKEVKRIDPGLKTGYTFMEKQEDLKQYESVDAFSVYSPLLDEKTIQDMRDMKKQIHAWTINDKEEMKRCKELGVDNIITDDVVLAIKTIRK